MILCICPMQAQLKSEPKTFADSYIELGGPFLYCSLWNSPIFSNLKGGPFSRFPWSERWSFYQRFSFLLCHVVLLLGPHPQDKAVREKRKKTKNRRLTCASFCSLVQSSVVAFCVFFRVFILIFRKNKLQRADTVMAESEPASYFVI